MVIQREPFLLPEGTVHKTCVSQHVCVLWACPFDQRSSLVLEVRVELRFHPWVEEPKHKLDIARCNRQVMITASFRKYGIRCQSVTLLLLFAFVSSSIYIIRI
jgi:hypothetical protein